MAKRPRQITSEWAKILQLIPNYDPVATAEGCWFDTAAAKKAIGFFADHLCFIEGEKAGEPFILELWQKAIVANLFGWKRPDGTRRYREAFIFVPRKNGKTPLAAGIIDYVGFCDNEAGAQLYSAAAEFKQAALIYRHAAGMINRNEELKQRCTTYKGFKSIEFYGQDTFYNALSSDADTKHGLNAHLVINDELHVQKDRDLIDTLETATASRKQPLIVHITTAGFDKLSICHEKYEYACQVRDGVIDNIAVLPVVYEIEEGDDWTDPAVWHKANPNLGVSVMLEYMTAKCKEAQDMPSKENSFKRLHLNMWTEQENRWLQMEHWDKCGGELCEDDLIGRECFGGLDLSTTTDISAFVLCFPDGEQYDILSYFWIPKSKAREREKRDKVPYIMWERQGFITMTPGNSIDYTYIRSEINRLAKKFGLIDVAYDPYNATHIATELTNDGIEMIQFRQGPPSMNEPCKEMERALLDGRICHGNHPVLKWMAGNVAVKTDVHGNICPVKPDHKSALKIDGIVSMAMSIGRAMFSESGPSVYESRGILTL